MAPAPTSASASSMLYDSDKQSFALRNAMDGPSPPVLGRLHPGSSPAEPKLLRDKEEGA